MKKFLLLLFAVIFAANAFAFGIGVNIYSDTSTVFLGSNDSIGVQLTLENTSSERQCVSIIARTDSAYVEAEPSLDNVCLNKSEKTNVTLNIRTIDAPPSGYFTVTLAFGDSAFALYTINVKTVSEPEIEMVVYDSDICRGENDYFSVLVKNNSNELKHIGLWADNEMLLPYFSPDEITLDAYDEEYVKVYVHAGRNTVVDTYTVSLFAESGSEQAKQNASIRVKDCLEEEIDFTVELSAGCQYADKGEEESVSYTVRNLTDNELELRTAVVSDLPTEYDSRITLEGNERRTFNVKVKPRLEDKVGRHDLTLMAWNPETMRSEEKTKCVYVRGRGASEVEIINNNLKIEQCLSEVFTLLVKNTGDTELDYRIRAVEDFNAINVNISDTRFELDSREQKYIYVAVTTTEDTALGNYNFDVITRFGRESITSTLKFEVVGRLPERDELEIASYPVQVKVEKGKETSFIVSIKNNTAEDLSGITVQVVDLPAGAFAPSIKNLNLKVGESRDVQLYIKAKSVAAGTYRAKIEAKTAQFKSSEDIEFIVEPAAAQGNGGQEEGNGFLAGLISIGSNVLLGLLVLAIAIALIVLIGKAFRGYGNKRPKEAWLRGV